MIIQIVLSFTTIHTKHLPLISRHITNKYIEMHLACRSYQTFCFKRVRLFEELWNIENVVFKYVVAHLSNIIDSLQYYSQVTKQL